MNSIRFRGHLFNIMTIQVYFPTFDAKEVGKKMKLTELASDVES